jgi:hypothetical protein
MRHTLMRFGLVTLTAGGIAGSTPAFYWVGWPGAKPVTPPYVTVVDPVPERPKPEPPQPPVDPPIDPQEVPEPTTLGVAAAGLGVLGVNWWRKRKKK